MQLQGSFESFGRSEYHRLLGRNANRLVGPWVPAHAGCALSDDEYAEAREGKTLVLLQSDTELLEKSVDDLFNSAFTEIASHCFSHGGYQFGFGHTFSS
jgi:hypothetical protein